MNGHHQSVQNFGINFSFLLNFVDQNSNKTELKFAKSTERSWKTSERGNYVLKLLKPEKLICSKWTEGSVRTGERDFFFVRGGQFEIRLICRRRPAVSVAYFAGPFGGFSDASLTCCFRLHTFERTAKRAWPYSPRNSLIQTNRSSVPNQTVQTIQIAVQLSPAK